MFIKGIPWEQFMLAASEPIGDGARWKTKWQSIAKENENKTERRDNIWERKARGRTNEKNKGEREAIPFTVYCSTCTNIPGWSILAQINHLTQYIIHSYVKSWFDRSLSLLLCHRFAIGIWVIRSCKCSPRISLLVPGKEIVEGDGGPKKNRFLQYAQANGTHTQRKRGRKESRKCNTDLSSVSFPNAVTY